MQTERKTETERDRPDLKHIEGLKTEGRGRRRRDRERKGSTFQEERQKEIRELFKPFNSITGIVRGHLRHTLFFPFNHSSQLLVLMNEHSLVLQ